MVVTQPLVVLSACSLGGRESRATGASSRTRCCSGCWQQRLATLGILQPVEQAWREVVLAAPDSPRMDLGRGRRLNQTPFRGFLLGRGWKVPYLGAYFEVPEGTRSIGPNEPVAVLFLESDSEESDTHLSSGSWRSGRLRT